MTEFAKIQGDSSETMNICKLPMLYHFCRVDQHQGSPFPVRTLNGRLESESDEFRQLQKKVDKQAQHIRYQAYRLHRKELPQ